MAVECGCSNILAAMLSTLWPCDLWPNTNWWARYRDKLSLFESGHFGFIVWTDRQNHRGRRLLYSRNYHRY